MQRLNELDNQLESLLAVDSDVASDLLQGLLQQREQLLQQLMAAPECLNKAEWQTAIERTTSILARIRHHRDNSAGQLQRFQHGQRSMQAYNKFR
ncbi:MULTISPECIES: flagellar rod protein FlaI [Photobacterium]|jgi:flagellar protein FlaI|uniref:Flagellar rod protein FlaI n=1 Tax=Photobacterium indicum TaxID=81447 RepID=A0A2T3LBL8_9GAMM|nr:flagellar rod protein FlaI [Photobacterium indicum]PSV48729.1 flagellar rod protein FlaI [Photobacterium indicum]